MSETPSTAASSNGPSGELRADAPRRFWFLRTRYTWVRWPAFRGMDEFGNRTLALRVTPWHYAVLALPRHLSAVLFEGDA